jgi:hypothetical protein
VGKASTAALKHVAENRKQGKRKDHGRGHRGPAKHAKTDARTLQGDGVDGDALHGRKLVPDLCSRTSLSIMIIDLNNNQALL